MRLTVWYGIAALALAGSARAETPDIAKGILAHIHGGAPAHPERH